MLLQPILLMLLLLLIEQDLCSYYEDHIQNIIYHMLLTVDASTGSRNRDNREAAEELLHQDTCIENFQLLGTVEEDEETKPANEDAEILQHSEENMRDGRVFQRLAGLLRKLVGRLQGISHWA